MRRYTHLFFDLDHTLWDFDRNSGECLTEIYHHFDLQSIGVLSCENFVETFIKINTQLWHDFDKGRIAHSYIRDQRFRIVFDALGIHDVQIGSQLNERYLELLPTKPHLLDGTIELLDYCTAKGYELHIISNGFDYLQSRKMESSKIKHYFGHIVTNEKAGAKKPDSQIFEYALNLANANKASSLMIGDNWEADVMGAMNFGIDAVYYNPHHTPQTTAPTYLVSHLLDLMTII